jgi:plasmid maintenance system killer protein|tara:strand:- start:238 stop:492 length:255 start_codon:yes stop_codon:yes gene_type:complete
LDTIHTIKNKGNSKLSQHKLIKAIRNLEMIDDTDSEISIAQSDASIYEPLEKRLQKVYSEKRLNPLDQEVLLNKCPAIEIEKQL